MIGAKRYLIQLLNKIAPNTFDDTFLEYNMEVKSKFVATLATSENYSKSEDLAPERKEYVLNEISSSLSLIDKFLFGYNFDHSYSKGLIWNMYNNFGVQCQTKFFQLLDDHPFDVKVKKVDISIGIIEGYTWDVDGDGQGITLPIFEKIYKRKEGGNCPRPVLILGNLIFDWDPLLYLCIPKKCVGNFDDLFGKTYEIGKIEVGSVVIDWNNHCKKPKDGEDPKYSYDLFEQILKNLIEYSSDFEKFYKQRLEGSFLLSLRNIEYRSGDKYFFEIQDAYFKNEENDEERLPQELSLIQNKRTILNSKQQLNSYSSLLQHALDNCADSQKDLIQMIEEFIQIYERSLPDSETQDRVEYYQYGDQVIKCDFEVKTVPGRQTPVKTLQKQETSSEPTDEPKEPQETLPKPEIISLEEAKPDLQPIEQQKDESIEMLTVDVVNDTPHVLAVQINEESQ